MSKIREAKCINFKINFEIYLDNIRGLEMLVFQKILRMCLMNNPLFQIINRGHNFYTE